MLDLNKQSLRQARFASGGWSVTIGFNSDKPDSGQGERNPILGFPGTELQNGAAIL